MDRLLPAFAHLGGARDTIAINARDTDGRGLWLGAPMRSQKRADALKDWLVKWGIDPKRLEARGFGGTKPLVPPDTKGSAAINDRVELIILERK